MKYETIILVSCSTRCLCLVRDDRARSVCSRSGKKDLSLRDGVA